MTATVVDTVTGTPRLSSRNQALARSYLLEGLSGAAAVAALIGFAYALWHGGGRDHGAANVALLAAAPAILMSRPWRHLRVTELALPAALLAAVAVVPLVTPLGISGVRDVNAYAYGVAFYLFMRSYATTTHRRRLVMVAPAALALAQFAPLWQVWVGQNDPSYMVVGTFYWHNQFGIFAAAVALFMASHAMRGNRIDDALAGLTASFFAAQAVLSQSRGAVLAFVVGAVLLLSVVAVRKMWGALLRLVAVGVAAAIITLGFLASVGAQGHGSAVVAKESASAASGFRADATRAALHVIEANPSTSSGFGTYAVQGPRWIPTNQTASKWSHSAELQAWTDGGALLGIPVLLVIAACLKRWGTTIRGASQSGSVDLTSVGAAAAGVAMLLHTSMDFDSQYPTLMAMFGMFAALATPVGTTAPFVSRRRSASFALLGLVGVTTVVTTSMVSSYWTNTAGINDAQRTAATTLDGAAALAADDMHRTTFTDPRPATLVVQLRDEGAVVNPPDLTLALAKSRAYAQIDSDFAAVWQRVAMTNDYR